MSALTLGRSVERTPLKLNVESRALHHPQGADRSYVDPDASCPWCHRDRDRRALSTPGQMKNPAGGDGVS